MSYEGVTLNSLLNPDSKETLLAAMLTQLEDSGIASTSWQEGQPELSLANVVAQVNAELGNVIAGAAAACFFSLAVEKGDKEACYELARSFFNVEPRAATAAVYTATITNDVGVAYPSRAIGSFQATTESGVVLSNLSVFSLDGTIGATVDVTLTAETAGTDGNAAPTTISVTSGLAGTSVEFVLITPGTDDEKLSQLQDRCLAKWSTVVVSGSFPTKGYASLAIESDVTIARAKVDPAAPRTGQAIDVYIAGASGTITDATVIATCQTYLSDRQAPTLDISVQGAAVQSQDVIGTIRVSSSLLDDSLKNQIRAAVSDYLRTLPIGGTEIAGNGFIIYSEIIGLITAFSGVEQVTLTEPVADVAVDPWSVVAPPDDTFPSLVFEAI